MADFRIFVEKQAKYNVEAKHLVADLKQNLHLERLSFVRVINCYDIFNLERIELERAKHVVFAEAPVDDVYEHIDLSQEIYLAIEPLPGQYDQRADSALQALNLLDINQPNLSIKTGKLVIFSGINLADLDLVKNYYLNPQEMREKNLHCLTAEVVTDIQAQIPVFNGFRKLNAVGLDDFRRRYSLAMSNPDLECIQSYFRDSEGRDPSETEIRVLDTYWSDHCRHTTFETQLTTVEFAAGKYQQLFQNAYEAYLASRSKVYGAKAEQKPICLMDLATICGKELKQQGKLQNVEFSAEINACSLLIDIEVGAKTETWSLQFKNETHNHPTEIEPFGGAATCVGGAIRDPLSGRAYVYQAMRVSGAANPLVAIRDTLPGKLAQRTICTKAAHGFSSYGNQIGLATTHVREIYHPGYQAKRLEVGMVVAAAPYANIRRETPQAGDAIILLGGRTGRDGCGGATGSSKEHDSNSATVCGAEVQKGNPVVERKIQRLFRNPELTCLIKKCNDFGAGGVAVAIGELADGILINLDALPTKYHGLNGTELAISESQERMALVVAAEAVDQVIRLAAAENLEAVKVATVSAEARMVIEWHGRKLVDLARSFLNTNGARPMARAKVEQPVAEKLLIAPGPESDFASRLAATLASLSNCGQQGLVDMFDATIGGSTVLMPYGGKYQLTPSQVSVQKLPLISAESDAASIASFGFDPYLSSKSPFHGAMYAVVESVAKIVAAGADYRQIKFSFQEYFEKLGSDTHKWGKPLAALLGAYTAQQEFELAAIGGKDSMSGTFNDLNVPPTLISFALAPTSASLIISPEFKAAANYVYAYIPNYSSEEVVDFKQLHIVYHKISEFIASGLVNAAYAIGTAGIAGSIALMSFGNKLGVEILNLCQIDWFAPYFGGLVFASNQKLTAAEFILLGCTHSEAVIRYENQDIKLADLISCWQATLAPVYPLNVKPEAADIDLNLAAALPSLVADTVESRHHPEFTLPLSAKIKQTSGKPHIVMHRTAIPRIAIPVFPGTNCEYDTERAFSRAGAKSESVVFTNLTPSQIQHSIDRLAQVIANSQILMLSGGFSAGDEPDGSAKFIATILRNAKIKTAIEQLLARDGLILGICNGFQALVKSGLLPWGQIQDVERSAPTLTFNRLGRHISRICATKIISNQSPWLSSFQVGEVKQVAMSHGEGRFVVSAELASQLFANQQVACQYVDEQNLATLAGEFNPNGSDYAIEALTSADGRILGKMGHSERMGPNLYKNISGDKVQDIFLNGVNYFTC